MSNMKAKLLALLWMFACASGLRAQTDTAYHLHHFLPDSAQFTTCFDGVAYSITGDTLINGKKMKKVYAPFLYYAAIYEDTLNAKYYAVYKGETEEKLFMDFSANVGDEVTVSDKYSTQKVTVDSVFFDKNGRKVVSIISDCHSNFDDWTEGIGSFWNILIPNVTLYCIADATSDAVARVTVGDSIVYEHFSIEDCKYLSQFRYNSINDSKTDANIRVYPNPAKEYLLINIEHFECCTYEIISVSGSLLQSGDLLPSIDICNLPQGLKLIVIKDDNNEIVYSTKFLKE